MRFTLLPHPPREHRGSVKGRDVRNESVCNRLYGRMLYRHVKSKAAFHKLHILFILIRIMGRFRVLHRVRCIDKISMHEYHLIIFECMQV